MWFAEPRLVALAVEVAAESFAVAAVALMLAFFLRRLSAAQRHLMLVAMIVALLVLPLASLILPSRALGMLPKPFEGRVAQSQMNRDAAAQDLDGQSAVVSARQVSEPAPRPAESRSGASWIGVAMAVWLAGAALLTLFLIGSRLLAWWVARRAPELEESPITDAVHLVAGRLKVSRPVSVASCNFFKVPFVSGTISPRLVLPLEASRWPVERMRAILHHELAHILRRDLLSQLLGQLACCLYWFNPLVWVMERRLFIERERACDDVALEDNLPASEYAGHLMEVMEEMGTKHDTLWVTAAMAEGTDFKDRILSVLDPGARRQRPRTLYTSLVVVFTLLLVLPLAVLSPWGQAAAETVSLAGEYDGGGVAARGPSPASEDEVGAGAQVDISSLIAVLHGPDASMREHAATALGRIGNTEATAALIEALNDDDPRVREHVASALGQLGDTEAVAPMGRVLLEDDNPRVREHVASALGRLGDAEAIGPLADVLLEDDNPRVREHAATALGQLGDSAAMKPLVRAMFEDEQPRVRAHAATGLGSLGDAAAVPPLIQVLENDSEEAGVRRDVAEALGEIGDPRAVEPLTRALEDASDEVRKGAVKALSVIR